MRIFIHYVAALALLTIYGGQVCPLIDTLTIFHWGSLLLVTFTPMVVLRFLLEPRVVQSAPVYDQPGRQFLLEFSLFAIFGLFLSIYDTVVLHFPPMESGAKVILGFISFGFFIGLDLALAREHKNGEAIIRDGITPPEASSYTTLTRKFSTFALATVALTGTIVILAVAKDVYWLSEVDMAKDGMMAQLLIMAEISFILAILCTYILTIIISYTRNIRLFFGNETSVLRQVHSGDLSGRVPALTRDEFGEIAAHTNTMIDGLRERDRIKSVFGKAVSPTIARRLMEQEEKGVSLGGSRQMLVILFSDIRNFTSYTESNPPEMVIKDVNAWFTEAVASIQDHGGIVDKFIGDGILAVFGLDGDVAACENAARCAMDMQARLQGLAPNLCEPMSVGIGIHKGEVLAGIVGSPERLEFTVVGDVVNTASRIEGMTRDLKASVLISKAVYTDLKTNMDLSDWRDYGAQTLKGKAEPIHLFGLPME
ncbi:adenylate/guanylate cyclase domain-containing protein [Pseudodesulfovibrio sp. zrk46]|uniref:adenylate/guanylate cyclase domain-containing protein n=1 Tax=Pseudodesulfovibrio sp. zrk46 TaxID=2725288 RepID=UPI00144959C1|nr:adenylate/guanylate cyclase domain-containing protein [Pseudodesulfovibrio sp. zrk46]QJB55633.1 adenylate/guanylate cyclase domain-containing protein [Pseudodesulfovibrio sp. zrk46]